MTMTTAVTTIEQRPGPGDGPPGGLLSVQGDCWNRIGVNGDRSCPELTSFVHCRNCPVFAAAARTFFDRPAPEGYLAEWARWLADSDGLRPHGDADGTGDLEDGGIVAQREGVSVLIFRLGGEWLAFRTRTVVEVTSPRPVHRVPHRSNRVLVGLVNLQGRAELCVSMHGLLGVGAPASASPRLVVLRDRDRAETWAFAADEVLGVHRVPRSQWGAVPSTLVNPAVGFSQAVLSWNGRSIGLLDEQRVFAALRSLGS
jgi:chemotaxis-related protein WspD